MAVPSADFCASSSRRLSSAAIARLPGSAIRPLAAPGPASGHREAKHMAVGEALPGLEGASALKRRNGFAHGLLL